MHIIKIYLTYIFLCVPFLIKASPADSLFRKADSLYYKGEFLKAGTQYEWIYFFEKDPVIKTQAQIKRIDCFTQQDQFEQAQQYAEQISLLNIPDSQAYSIRFKRSFNAYLAENFNTAKSHFIQLKFYHPGKVYETGSIYLYLLILNELTEWDEAKKEFSSWIGKTNYSKNQKDSLLLRIDEIYHKKDIPKLKSPQKARAWSTFIPGSGQMYAGYVFEGIFNLTIHFATLAFAAEEIIHGFYITGYFGGLGLFQKFYFGGLKRTEYLTKKTNYKRSQEFNKKAKKNIMEMQNQLANQ